MVGTYRYRIVFHYIYPKSESIFLFITCQNQTKPTRKKKKERGCKDEGKGEGYRSAYIHTYIR